MVPALFRLLIGVVSAFVVLVVAQGSSFLRIMACAILVLSSLEIVAHLFKEGKQ